MKDCYRSYGDLYGFFYEKLEGVRKDGCSRRAWEETCEHVARHLSDVCTDLEMELRKYGIPDEDVPSIMDRICDAEVNEAITGKPGLMDVADMIMHKKPAMDRCPEGSDHLDRCPEDILKEQIESEDE